MKSHFRVILSDVHRRALSVRLTILDETLDDLEAWARGRERDTAFRREANRLSPGQRETILEQVRSLRELLSQWHHDLSLETRATDASHDIWAHCVSLWDTLAELEPAQLRQYGEVSAELADYLRPGTQEIHERLKRILDGVRPPAQS